MERASLSISLSRNDAVSIRKQVAIKHCSVNEYVLGARTYAVPFDDRLYKREENWGFPTLYTRTGTHRLSVREQPCISAARKLKPVASDGPPTDEEQQLASTWLGASEDRGVFRSL